MRIFTYCGVIVIFVYIINWLHFLNAPKRLNITVKSCFGDISCKSDTNIDNLYDALVWSTNASIPTKAKCPIPYVRKEWPLKPSKRKWQDCTNTGHEIIQTFVYQHNRSIKIGCSDGNVPYFAWRIPLAATCDTLQFEKAVLKEYLKEPLRYNGSDPSKSWVRYPGYPIPVKSEVISIKCSQVIKVETVVMRNPGTKPVGSKKQVDTNVLLIFMDSVSRANFMRYFPITKQWLQNIQNSNEYNVGVFKRYLSRGNTQENTYPLMTGEHFVASKPSNQYQNWLFNIAKQNGYVTSMASSYAQWFYNSRSYGPDVRLTDHMKPSTTPADCWAAIMNSKNQSESICNFGKSSITYALDYTHQVFSVYKDNPIFAAINLLEAHGPQIERAQMIDHYVGQWLPKFLANFPSTALFFLSDHGNQVGQYGHDFASTTAGTLEISLPFLTFVAPKTINAMFLSHNQESILNTYDIHCSIAQIFRKSYVCPGKSRSILAQPIPYSRTCDEINHPKDVCACDWTCTDSRYCAYTYESKQNADIFKSKQKAVVQNCGIKTVNVINKFLSQFNNTNCVNLKLDKVNMLAGGSIIFEVEQDNAMFIGKSPGSKDICPTFKITDLTQTTQWGNKYKHCVDNRLSRRQKQYCICK